MDNETNQEFPSEHAQLASRGAASIDKPVSHMCVAQLVHELLERYPRADAEPWDVMGLVAGDPARNVTGVACALDPTVEAIRACAARGANVLLTHHPAFLEPPSCFSNERSHATAPGTVIYEAVKQDVALVNIHTALDVSHDAQYVLPSMLGLVQQGVMEPVEHDATKGYGQLCSVREGDKPMTLSQLASRCLSVFGRMPRVWGDSRARIETVVTATGSAGDLPAACLSKNVSCLVCGEVKYHSALDASQGGLCLIELGHDVSELPLAGVLARAVVDLGVDSSRVFIVSQDANWFTPDATRV